MAETRGKKREHHEEHEEHVNHEAWVIPYADMLTLLMALFLVLFALGQNDQEKLDLAAQSFRKELNAPSLFNFGSGTGGSGPLAAGGDSVLDGVGPKPEESSHDDTGGGVSTDPADPRPAIVVINPDGSLTESPAASVAPVSSVPTADETLGDPLAEVEQTVRERAAGTGLTDAIGFRREARGLVVTIVTDQVLFAPGQAAIQPGGFTILDVVADALADLPNDVTIEGHTDSRPISTARYPSNWELSTSRATSVLRYLVEARGFPTARLSAAGYADTHPVDAGNTPEALARNRRVEIVVLATAESPASPLEAPPADAGSNPEMASAATVPVQP
jgi:chemotaxis protein MotB